MAHTLEKAKLLVRGLRKTGGHDHQKPTLQLAVPTHCTWNSHIIRQPGRKFSRGSEELYSLEQ